MIDFFRHGRFVFPPAVGLCVLVSVSLVLFMMVMASNESRVRTSDARCEVGEVMTGSETIKVKLACAEASGTTDTSISQAASVVSILQHKPATVTCNVMHTGWARDCRVP
jgi:hypothetical protein